MGVMNGARDLWARVVEPAQWPRRRAVGEAVLALVMGLLVGASEYGTGHGWLGAAPAAVATAVFCLTRRALPTTSLVAVAVVSGVTDMAPLLLLPVVGWSAGRRIRGVLRALAAWSTAFALFGVLILWDERPFSVMGIFVTLLFLVVTVVPGLAGRYWSQRRTLLATLQERNLQLMRERQMIVGQARLRERQRIAQDMHDSLGHQLALIAVQTGALEVSRELTGPQREAVGVLREASVAAMHELRAVVGVLKDGTVEEEPAAPGGVAGIAGLVESAVAAGTPVRSERSGEARPLAAPAGHAAYRVVQEGLTNAFKHAPGAPLTVGLHYESDSLVVEVANGPVPKGAGARPAAVSGGQGLAGLRERARLAGGMLHAGPVAEGGFRLAAVLPYDTGRAPEAAAADGADAGDDLGPRIPVHPPGGPVIDRLDPREEFKDLMDVKRSRRALVGCGLALVFLVGLGVVAAVGVGVLMEEANKALVGPETYRSVRTGTPEDEVRDRLPSGQSFLTSDARAKAPAEPARSRCLYLLSTESPEGWDTDLVYRFCFRDGKLIEKREFSVKSD